VWAPDEGGAHGVGSAPRSLQTGAPARALFKFLLATRREARHEDAPLAVATQITDFCIKIPFQVSANVIGRAPIRATVDIRWAEGAAQRIDPPEVNPCCRPGNLD
jgi:hypothetical protein